VASQAPSPKLYVETGGNLPYWSPARPEVESKLNRLLVNHQEFSPTPSMTRMVPAANFVSYDVQR
jgi:hypothetical protein